jgi:hypothetical protein
MKNLTSSVTSFLNETFHKKIFFLIILKMFQTDFFKGHRTNDFFFLKLLISRWLFFFFEWGKIPNAVYSHFLNISANYTVAPNSSHLFLDFLFTLDMFCKFTSINRPRIVQNWAKFGQKSPKFGQNFEIWLKKR